MPAKNTIKQYLENSYYHIYNRGVEKRIIFTDEQDYKVFLSFIKSYLTPLQKPHAGSISFTVRGVSFKATPRQLKNHAKEVDLIAYCLMPNHFHFLVKQRSANAIEAFMRSLTTRYSMYFNKKHQRVGPLFQGPYKAIRIEDEPYLLHLTRYIHLNPKGPASSLTEAYSSYKNYLKLQNTPWIKPTVVLEFFSKDSHHSYESFIEAYTENDQDYIKHLTLE